MDKHEPATGTAQVFTSMAGAFKHFFGYRPGETLKDFTAEYKALTPGDREEIRKGLEKLGYKFDIKPT